MAVITSGLTKSKICRWCETEKEFKDFYSQNKTKANGEKYIYVNPECKECTKNNSTKWRKGNPERYKVFYTNRNQKEYFKEKMRKAAKIQRESGYQKKYYNLNKDKFPAYRDNRKSKTHDITDYEWEECLRYFDYSCAYCGISEDEQIKKYNQVFSRDHVIDYGSNYIDNCVPACKGCNSQKSNFEFNEWYNAQNYRYSERKIEKIVKWMTIDCLSVLNLY